MKKECTKDKVESSEQIVYQRRFVIGDIASASSLNDRRCRIFVAFNKRVKTVYHKPGGGVVTEQELIEAAQKAKKQWHVFDDWPVIYRSIEV